MTLEEFTEKHANKFVELAQPMRKKKFPWGSVTPEFASVFNQEIGKDLEDNLPITVMREFLRQRRMNVGMKDLDDNLVRMFFVAHRNGINTLGELRVQKDSEYLHTGLKGKNRENSHNFLVEAFKPAPKEEAL